jgi:hypothetical protein
MYSSSCTLESISGSEIYTIAPKPIVIRNKNKLENLIDYLLYCDGYEYITINPPKDIHKEALKIKIMYPLINVVVLHNRIKMSI